MAFEPGAAHAADPHRANDEAANQASTAHRAPLTRVPWASVALFVALAYGLAWLVALPLWLTDLSDPGSLSPAQIVLVQLVPMVMMFTPAVATLVVVFFAKTPRTERMRFLGMWPLRPAKRVVWFIVIGNFLPIVIVALALAVATLCGWYAPDFALSAFTGQLSEAFVPPESIAMVLVMQLAMIPLAGILNALPSFGEEIGWRGWLTPALRPLGTWPALILSGVIWGVWHTPITLVGHNFGLYDWRGVALMTVGCVFWGVIFGWLRLRSGSVWPAVIAHGALNGSAGLFMVFATAGVDLPLALVNPLGVSGWIAAAIFIVILAATRQFTQQPPLAPNRPAPSAADFPYIEVTNR